MDLGHIQCTVYAPQISSWIRIQIEIKTARLASMSPPPPPSLPPSLPPQPLYRDLKKTSNIEAYVEWFNRLSYLVATEICVSDKKRNRTRLVEFFLDTAAECKRLNNFNSFMAIIGKLL